MKRRVTLRTTLQSALLIAGVIFAGIVIANLVSFLSSRSRLPPGTMMGDIDVSQLSIDEAVTRTIRTLQNPVALRYQNSIIQLTPADVDFQVNDVVLRLLLEKTLQSQQGLDKLPDYALRRTSVTHLNVPYQYSQEKLDAYLAKVAHDYDQAAVPATPDPAALAVKPGKDGMALNRADAQPLILNALASSTSRFVDLPIDDVPANATTLTSLGNLIQARLAKFGGASVTGLFIKNLGTGQEFAINGDIAFSAEGWIRIAIVAEGFRSISQTGNSALVQQLASVVTNANHGSVNDVLRVIGQGDAQAGVTQVNATMKRMGLVSTFIAQPFDQPSNPPQYITPGNARLDVSTSPDANVQSTPADISLLLENLEECRNNSGALLFAFPNEFTPSKCEQVLNTIGQNDANILIAAGSSGSTVIHRQSWDSNNHGDVALIRSPGGTYVLAIMLHGNNSLNWSDTSLVISDIARASYAFFNKGQLPAAVPAMNAPPPP